ncbi:MAG: ABC transporter permease [Firmicutes bacterium]|nr:ABC transporter permease [Bacillota bacterium]
MTESAKSPNIRPGSGMEPVVHPRVISEPLWRIRWRLNMRSLAQHWAIFRESRIGIAGLVVIVCFGVFGMMWPLMFRNVWDPNVYHPVVGFDPTMMHPAAPCRGHLLGTDPIGRDILAQLMFSTGREFLLGVLSAMISVVVGTFIGAMAAYYGGFTDAFFMRLADIVMLFPFVPLLVVVGSLVRLDMFSFAIILGFLEAFGGITIILKAQALQVKVRPYIDAAKVAGGDDLHIIRSHIIPNVLPLSFLYMMFNVTAAILSEATLSFFGVLNIDMSWGMMIHTAETAGYLFDYGRYWWLWLPSGLAITLFCAAFYMVGRGLDEVVNPRLRKR